MFECVFVGESESIVLFIALHCLFHEFFMNWSRVQCLGKAAFVLFIVKSPVSYRKKIVSTLLMFLHLVYCLFKELYFFVAFFFFLVNIICVAREMLHPIQLCRYRVCCLYGLLLLMGTRMSHLLLKTLTFPCSEMHRDAVWGRVFPSPSVMIVSIYSASSKIIKPL